MAQNPSGGAALPVAGAPVPARSKLRVPPVVVLFGPSKVGKTTACGYLDPEALFLAGKGALSSIEALTGITLKHARDDCNDVESIRKAVIDERKKRIVRTVVVDDFSLAVKNTVAKLELSYTGWNIWKNLNRLLLSPTAGSDQGLLPVCRDMGIKVVFNCHDKPPEDDQPGGPNLPGQLLEELPRNTDMVLLMTADPAREPHGASLRASLKHYPQWRTGDRHDVCWERTPPNLEEVLRVNFHIEWPTGHEWMEEYVEYIATQIAGAGMMGAMAVKAPAWEWLMSNKIPTHLAGWILRNACDRAEIRKHEQQKWLLKFGLPVPI